MSDKIMYFGKWAISLDDLIYDVLELKPKEHKAKVNVCTAYVDSTLALHKDSAEHKRQAKRTQKLYSDLVQYAKRTKDEIYFVELDPVNNPNAARIWHHDGTRGTVKDHYVGPRYFIAHCWIWQDQDQDQTKAA